VAIVTVLPGNSGSFTFWELAFINKINRFLMQVFFHFLIYKGESNKQKRV